ncbi:MAG TPA: NAD+ synthase [Candidatus Dormibacteraeota bacterium]|jgi:NAD+ synthase (glutamine-hydrolysing)|nr:NAD+ synthase [Candidatus Dormibacteraeota bacterium]
MKIALAQFNPTVGDFAGNSARIISLSETAKQRGADLAVFSELCLCGYPPNDLLERPAFIDRNQKELKTLAKALAIPSVVGFVGRVKNGTGKSIANKAALLCGGKVTFEQSKMLLPTYDVFDESRYFQPAEKQQTLDFHGESLGVTICEDAWNDENFWPNRRYDRDPVTELIEQGTQVLLNISASPYTIDKRALRVDMLRSIAVHNRKSVIYVNQFGGNDSLIFDGASVALTPDGKVAAQALAFEEDLVLFDTVTGEGEIHEQPRQEIEYAFRALVIGTRDYVRKCGFKKVLVGLSGGIDSAVVAAIAVHALGAENVLGVSMPGPFSSEGSRNDAASLAKNLGIEFMTLPIDGVFDAYRTALKPAFGRRKEDVTEENIQARIRGNYLMALSNKFGSMVLSTGNKSENAVGYCTLYGDMAGGLAVISDVPKLMVYELANWINRERELIPRSTIDKPPSAELRPDQKDEDSLPPYDVLDRILKAYIEDLKSPQEIADKYDFDIKMVREIALMVDRNEYKRKQAAPGLKITSRAFGFGRPFPIAQKFIP